MYLSFSLYPFTISSQTTSLPVFSLIRLNLMLLRSLLSSISRSSLLESVAEYSLMGIFTRPKPTAPFQIALIVSFFKFIPQFSFQICTDINIIIVMYSILDTDLNLHFLQRENTVIHFSTDCRKNLQLNTFKNLNMQFIL